MLFHSLLSNKLICASSASTSVSTTALETKQPISSPINHTSSSPSESVSTMGIWIRDEASEIAGDVGYAYKWSCGEENIGVYSTVNSNINDSSSYSNFSSISSMLYPQQVSVMDRAMGKEGYAACQARQTNLLIGESHMR